MVYSDDEKTFFRLLLKLARSSQGRKANSLFGPGAGLEEATTTVSRHFAGDHQAIRRFGYGAGALLDRFVSTGSIRERDIGAIMGAAHWPGETHGMVASGPETSAFLLGAAALETWAGNAALRAHYRSDDATALEIASWLGMAVARFEATGRTPSIPTPERTATRSGAAGSSHLARAPTSRSTGVRATPGSSPSRSAPPSPAGSGKTCSECGKANLSVRLSCYACGGGLRAPF